MNKYITNSFIAILAASSSAQAQTTGVDDDDVITMILPLLLNRSPSDPGVGIVHPHCTGSLVCPADDNDSYMLVRHNDENRLYGGDTQGAIWESVLGSSGVYGLRYGMADHSIPEAHINRLEPDDNGYLTVGLHVPQNQIVYWLEDEGESAPRAAGLLEEAYGEPKPVDCSLVAARILALDLTTSDYPIVAIDAHMGCQSSSYYTYFRRNSDIPMSEPQTLSPPN
ncbi:hypothetical protein OAS86_02275 [Gammaproteobacteria bacterium]|nr:hypothetical protein [Gammaproteobacteria bacterium]